MIKLFLGALIVLVVSVGVKSGKTISSKAGITPDSPLYFLDSLAEKVDIWGTKEKEKKVEKLTALIEEKMHEASTLLEKGESALAGRALKLGDEYTNQALGFVNSLKAEGASIGDLAQDLGGAILEKQKILADSYKKAPETTKSVIEKEIQSGQEDIKKVVEKLDAKSNEKLTSKIEQTQELVDDKVEETKEKETKKELEDLTKQEQKYNIWLDHFYATEEDGMTAVSAHIRRRDPKCSKFSGKFKLYINKTFYREFNLTADGYDDVRKTFDKFFLEKGTYWMTGVLEDMSGNKISNKQMKLII